jgi:hypothetical protein
MIASFRGNIWCDNGTIYISSDSRIKKNVLDINDDTSLQKILLIEPKTYEYKDLSASDFVQKSAKSPTADEDFFVYRDYLYFEKAASYHVVNVQNAYYIKFPPTFAIRARGEDLADLHVCNVREDTLHGMFFFTAFDTRRYSWFCKYRLDTEEDTRDIENFEKISLSPGTAGCQTVSDH